MFVSRMGKIAAVLLCTGLLIANPALAINFSDTELTALKAGKTLKKPLPTSRKNGFYGGSGWTVIDAPVDLVWQHLQQWQAYPKIFKHTEEVKELSRKNDRSLLRVKMGYKILNITYHLDIERDQLKRQLTFRMVKNRTHDIQDTRGYWRLFPQQDGTTLVAYVVAAQVPMGIVNFLGPRIEEKLERHILGMPENLKKWIERGTADQNKLVASAK